MLTHFENYLEKIRVTPIGWLLGVSGVLIIRFFLESLSNPTSSGLFASDASTLVHYFLFFMAGLMILLVFFQVALPKWKNIIPQFMALSLPVIFVPPIIDWLVSGGKGIKMTYFFDTPQGLLYSFFHFGSASTSIGLRGEVALALLGVGFLVFSVQRSWKRAVLSSLTFYGIVLLLASIPSLVSAIGQAGGLLPTDPVSFFKNVISVSLTTSNNLHGAFLYSSPVRLLEIGFNFIMGKILFLIGVSAASLWFYINFKEKFMAVIRNSRIERIAHYILTIFVGMAAAFVKFYPLKLNWNDWLSAVMLALSFFFSCLFAICVNDMADEDIDKVSNKDRPLITGDLSKEDMKQLAGVFILASFVSGFLAGYTAFFFILAFTSLYYVYSAAPTRFKLIPLFSSFLIGLCYLTAALAGFFLISPVKYVSAFPPRLAVAVVVITMLLAHARDLKDMQGDRIAGIKTVSVLFGEIWGPRVVGVLAFVSFFLLPIFADIPVLFISAVPSGIISYYFINKKPYSEKPLVRTYFFFVLTSLCLLFFT